MELKKIEELIDRYFEGSSNEKEEQVLRSYFLQENVAPHLIQYQSIFSYFSKAKEENFQPEFVVKDIVKRKKNNRFLISIAASVLVLIGTSIFMFTNYYPDNHNELGTYNDPKIALKETQKALSLLSKHVNTGYESVQYIDEYEITRDKIFNLN